MQRQARPSVTAATCTELDLLADLGQRFALAGKLEEAGYMADGLVALYPEEAVGHVLRGVVAETRGDRGAARAAYERAVARNPTDPVAILNLGRMRVETGRPDQGLRDIRWAWQMERDKGSEVARLARVLLDRWAQARREEEADRGQVEGVG